MAGVGVGVGCRIHWTGVMGTGLGGGLSGVRVAGTMVNRGDNAGRVSVGTLGDGAGQYVWSTPTGAGRSVFGVTAVEGFSVTLEKMHESVWMVANLLSSSVANRFGVGCKRALASAKAAAVAVHVELPSGTGNRVGRNLLFWRCVLRECVGCRHGVIGSGQVRV